MDLGVHNTEYLEEMYRVFVRAPEQLDPELRRFFQELESQTPTQIQTPKHSQNNAKVEAMINTFRRRGHLKADLNPLTDAGSSANVPYSLQDFALQTVDPQQLLYPTNLSGVYSATAQEIIEILQQSYCGAIGVDYVEINNEERVQWISKKLEQCAGRMTFTAAERQRILWDLLAAEGLEKFLHTRYLGQKRFSLEGCDSLIPMLDFMLSTAASQGVEDVCVGMAHRGRLNVLANIMHKDLASLFAEFEDSSNDDADSSFDIDGDVKYHLGFSTSVQRDGRDIAISLLPNPSHLEAINPVLEGYVRAKQRQRHDSLGTKTLPLLIHGDASFSGQGVVYETLNLSKLPAYSTGGTVHIVIDNQIGFTTNPDCARSTEYCSDIVKAIRAPVFHVNADDPEATVLTAILAFSYRQKFHSDVVIHLVGYRRYGHNEGDEPAFTQPLMYKKIKTHPRVAEKYISQDGKFALAEVDALRSKYRRMLDDAYQRVKNLTPPKTQATVVQRPRIKTAVNGSELKDLAVKITSVPDSFTLHPKIAKLFQQRRAMWQTKIDWGMAELLALAALAREGIHLRLSGQDVQRGTFSSRHAVVWDLENGSDYQVLAGSGNVDIINSPLSEFGALGFEFGYSVVGERTLVLWEAQFGDFSNGAQVIIDQFLSASAAKWEMHSNLVLLLPHGYEGMGPEHSNARPERFLQLCGNNNMQVAVPSTAAQYFHLLRRQALAQRRQPLVVMSPKSMLRHPQVSSPLQAFTKGTFAKIIDDDAVNAADVKKIIFCAGKIYYELLAARGEKTDTAIIRFEYLYPFPSKVFADIIGKYKHVAKIIWAQEEPQNMGGWSYIRAKIERVVKMRLHYVGRRISGTTAEGSLQAHRKAQSMIVRTALGYR
ncbi:MAG: 2-oxoglutarate dehydrogenase E1 component [Pseudomonadota bacterium]|nr:2-oxoglutarate dehydrogenase E1 component [Pseudomonadota bacterium]